MSRVKREFYITIRPNGSSTGKSEKKDEKVAEKKSLKKVKYSRRQKSDSSLIDDIATFIQQKTCHWALVVEPDVAEAGSNPKQAKRVFEICTEPGEDTDSGTEDRYDSDEDLPKSVDPPKNKNYPGKTDKRLGMRAKAELRKPEAYGEPDYKVLGGVFWDIVTRLKSQTKFTNSEIRHEARRIWERQQDYRLLDNNCQRFCILLAISIRARQNTTLRLLNAKIVKKQSGKTEKLIGKVVKGITQS